ncbi:hypothetical protein QOZ83_16920 [Romboutsia sedimentorum]|uniref:hypothetical protein n=1 Tax=Romboutsia sedimentorum TaxID=1368474 RepID=UPI0024DE9850|nr:hypothetical protein [Romboutsia sedimentorum]MDK2587523.1 hypothetical protein [Romboutsia sedimentorum]
MKDENTNESYDYKNLNKELLHHKRNCESKIDSRKYDIKELEGLIAKTKTKLDDFKTKIDDYNSEIDYLYESIVFGDKAIAYYEDAIKDNEKELMIEKEKLSDFISIIERAKLYPKQVVKLKNSNMHNMHFGKLHN